MTPPTSPAPSSPDTCNNTDRSQKRAISEVISKTFPPFDHRTTVVEPFDNEAKRDTEFLESEYDNSYLKMYNISCDSYLTGKRTVH